MRPYHASHQRSHKRDLGYGLERHMNDKDRLLVTSTFIVHSIHNSSNLGKVHEKNENKVLGPFKGTRLGHKSRRLSVYGTRASLKIIYME